MADDPKILTADDVIPPPKRKARSMASIADSLRQHFATPNRTPGVLTGIERLDMLIGSGMRPGNMAIIAADTGVGKSLLGFQIARHNASLGLGRVLYVSAEMPGEDLGMRLISAETGVPVGRQRDGKIEAQEWAGDYHNPGVMHALGNMADLPIDVLDDGDFTIDEIEQEMALCENLRLCCIDYSQLVDSTAKHNTQAEAMKQISKRLRAAAARHKCVVIAMAQVNRASEGRADKELRLSDIAESGSLAKDSMLVMMLERDVNGPRRTEAVVRVRKNRFGVCGVVNLAFNTATLTFKGA